LKIRDDIHWIGTLNPVLRTFDVIMRTEYGTTYNSYLICDEKTAILDASLRGLTDLFMGKVKATVEPSKVDYIIIHHTEPDHTGALGMLLDACPNAQVISTKIGAKWLREMLNRDFNSRTVEDGEEISLGKRTLRFMTVPFWHWPDTMFTYVPEEKILFPCDGFAAHFCDERMYDDLVDADIYEREREHYYDSIMRPFADKIFDGVQKVKQLDIEMICPSHGPIIRRDVHEVIDLYERLSVANRTPEQRVTVLYASAYGNTRRMAEVIAEGAMEHASVSLFDAANADPAEVRSAIEASKGIIAGSCTINGDALEPIWELLALFALVNKKGKVGASFGSFGWSGEAVGMIEERMRSLRLKVIESGLRFCFVPTEDDLAKCRAFGNEFAKGLGG
jgi:flavorubredoxin